MLHCTTVNGAFSTNSANAVTGNANTDDSATSSDMVRSITLANPEETFTYTLSVENNAERPMTKLVMIDTLPQLEDTSPFDTYVKRDSEFTVELAGNPSFKVQVTAEDGTVTILNPDQYSLEYSIATDFGGGHSDDWKGKDTGKWNASAAEARAIRIIIEDEGGTLIPDGATVSVSFDVKAADPEAVKPGQTAWNTFGYHYAIKVNSITTELEAMPLEVGVTIPQEWKLQKKLVDPEGKSTMTSGKESFTFLLYEGESLTENFNSKEDWITALTDARRPYGEFSATVPERSSESQPLLLDWTWKTGASYTIVEMPVGDGYRTESLGGSTGNSHTFQYDPKRAVTMECVNVLEHWSIHLTKTDEKDEKDEKGKVLPGAVFALYSPDPADQIQIPAEYSRIDISATRKGGEDSWYLADVSESDEDGQILWDALLRDSYLVLEVKAPAGYKLPDSEGELVYRSSAVALVKELEVENCSGYELPETGGVGTGIFTILGLGLTGISGILGILTRRRKKR